MEGGQRRNGAARQRQAPRARAVVGLQGRNAPRAAAAAAGRGRNGPRADGRAGARAAPKKRSRAYYNNLARDPAPLVPSAYELGGPVYVRVPQYEPYKRTRVRDVREERKRPGARSLEWVSNARASHRNAVDQRDERKVAFERRVGRPVDDEEVPYYYPSTLGVRRIMLMSLDDDSGVTQIAEDAVQKVGVDVSNIAIELLRRAGVNADMAKMVTIRPIHLEAAYRAMTNDV